jgi:putative DNA-invertase from lambdoid prophage Rac
MPEQAPLRLVAYCRVSTDDQGQNPERQRDLLVGFAARQGHEIVAWVIDEGTSGGVPPMDRVLVQEAIRTANRANADGILVESVDRWTRVGPLDFFQSSANLELRHKLRLVLADEPTGMDAMAQEIFRSIMAIVSKAFRERLREQIKSGLARAKKEGWKNGVPGRQPKPNLAPHEIAYVREQKALGRKGCGWGRMALELTRRRGALEVVDRKARERRTVTATWLRSEWHRILTGSMTRTWRKAPEPVPLQYGRVVPPAEIHHGLVARGPEGESAETAEPEVDAAGPKGVQLHG